MIPLLDAICSDLGPTELPRLAREGARAVMDVTFAGIYQRTMSMIATPQLYARFASRIWRSYYDTGDFTVVIHDARHAETRIRDWTAHHDLLCVMNIEAACAVFTTIGKRNVRTGRRACVSQGAPDCVFDTAWEA